MSPEGAPTGVGQQERVAYLFTRFPHPSETFLRREVQAMRELGVDVRPWSLWGGSDTADGRPVRRVRWWTMFQLLWRWPLEWLRRPEPFAEVFEKLLDRPWPSALNLGENLWGLGCAMLIGRDLRRQGITRCHAVWGSMPAATAWLVWRLYDIPYTMGAHAYDVFEDGGDWVLPLKLRDARLVHTTTESAAQRLRTLGAPEDRLAMIRRGLMTLPPYHAPRPDRSPLRLVSIGRLVEKKGFDRLLRLCADLREAGIECELRIAGSGPLRAELNRLVQRLGLSQIVSFSGWLDEAGIHELLAWADAFVFTGRVARSGDRDGLPNALGEAMAAGLPVLATAVGGVPEIIRHGENGFILPEAGGAIDRPAAVDLFRQIRDDDALAERVSRAARNWAEREFDARHNAETILKKIIDQRL